MTKVVIIAAATALAVIGWWLASPADQGNSFDLADRSDLSKPPTSTITEPAAVFQKAFWKRPTPEDQILHAERREWADKDGLTKWQWFIAVKPSPALVDHLITNNAFILSASRSGRRQHAEAPDWFPKTPGEHTQDLTNATGTFQILWDKDKNLLHATDSGNGFRPSAPESVWPIVQNTPTGRLPTTPPPKP